MGSPLIREGIMKKAYCKELGRIVTAREIWEGLFVERSIKQALTFKCADSQCRAPLVPMNMYQHLSSQACGFKLFPRAKHEPVCIYMAKAPVTRFTSYNEAKELLLLAEGFLLHDISQRLEELEQQVKRLNRS
jgi:hypothetical protein